jgi:hypothetical protein
MEVMSGMENKFAEHRWQNYRAEVRRYRGKTTEQRCVDTEGGGKKILTLKPLFAAAA